MRTSVFLLLIFILGSGGVYAQRQQAKVTYPACGNLGVPTITGTQITVNSSTTASVKVDWANGGEANYSLLYKAVGGMQYTACSGKSIFSCTANLPLGNSYVLRVESSRWCQQGAEVNTEEKSYEKTITLPPPAPTGLNASNVTPVAFTASWQLTPLASYYLYDVSSSSAFITYVVKDGIANTTGASVSNLTSGTTYYYRVRAVGATSTSPYSAIYTVNAVKPAPPASITATPPTGNQFTINWAASVGATSYQIDVATDASFSTGVVINNESVSTTSKTVTGISFNTKYYARVRAVNPAGASANSPVLIHALPPAAPINLSVTLASTNAFIATWTPSPGAINYRVDVATNAQFATPLIASNATTSATVYTQSGLKPGATYFVRVRAVNTLSTLPSENSVTLQVLLKPGTPTIIDTLTTATPSSLTISWTSNDAVSQLALDYADNENFTGATTVANIPAAPKTYTVNGLSAGKIYHLRMRHVNAAGTSANSATSAAFTKLATPTMLEATGVVTPDFFVARWTTVPYANVYWLDVSTDPNFSTFVPGYEALGAETDNIPVSGLTYNTKYYYRVRAGNDVSSSDYAASQSVQTPVGVPQVGSGGDDPFKMNVIPPSPEASALAKYADIPVSLYSGTPNISVPLYDIKERSLTLPISLSYHASGHKVETIAPRTGLGWTLNAGGAVTRAVRGLADEQVKGFLQFAKTYKDIGTVLDLDPSQRYLLYAEMVDGCRDGEPDVFYFNFNGYSGQFMFDWDGQIKVLSGNSIKIEPIGMPSAPTVGDYIDGWKITVDDGTVFTFNVIETTKVLQTYEQGPVCSYLEQLNQGKMPQTWYLSEMRSPDQQSWIHFEYDGYVQQNESWSMETLTHNQALSPAIVKRQITVSEISGKNLRKITVSSGQTVVDFLPSSAPRTDVTSDRVNKPKDNFALGQVHITNALGTVLKHWDMDYHYGTNRLTLDKVTERVGSVSKPPYTFTYNGALPDLLSYKRDHWGFLNNNPESHLIPAITLFRFGDPAHKGIHLGGADRSPSASGALAGLLTQIEYPTGGRDVLSFQLHDYSFEQGEELFEKITNKYSVTAISPRSNDDGGLDGSGPFRTESKTFTLTQEVDMLYNATFSYGYHGPGGGALASVSMELTDSQGKTIFSLAPGGTIQSDGSAGSRIFSDTLYKMPPGTYTLTTTAKIPPAASLGQNSVGVTLSWQIDTGERKPRLGYGGGARIGKITRIYGNDNPDKVTVYKYTLEEEGETKSSGSLLETQRTYSAWMDYAVPLTDKVFGTEPRFVRFSQNRTALGTTQGSHVGYGQVTVLSGEQGENGVTVYRFNSPREVHDVPRLEVPFPPAQSRDWRRGATLLQAEYANTGIGVDTIHRVKSIYKPFSYTIPAIKIGWAVPGAYVYGPNYLYTFAVGNYANEMGYLRLVKTEDKNFDQAGDAAEPLIQTTQYEYAETTHKQLIKTSFTNSKNETIVSAVKYPGDYSSTGAMATLQKLHMDNVPVEALTWKQGTGNQVSLLSGIKTEFSLEGSGVAPSAKYGARIASPVASSDPFGTIQPLYEKRLDLTDYDDFLNIKEHALTSGMKTAYQWAYNGTVPVAMAEHAASSQIFFESFEEDGTATTTQKRTGRKSRQINGTYSLPPGNRPTIAGDYVLSYWTKTGSGSWTYQENSIANYTPGAAITTDAVSGFIDDVRLYTAGAQMKTFTYEPGVGVTSVTDGANATVYYEYDVFNRLVCIRDQDGNIVQQYDYQFKLEIPYEPIK